MRFSFTEAADASWGWGADLAFHLGRVEYFEPVGPAPFLQRFGLAVDFISATPRVFAQGPQTVAGNWTINGELGAGIGLTHAQISLDTPVFTVRFDDTFATPFVFAELNFGHRARPSNRAVVGLQRGENGLTAFDVRFLVEY
ncbi:MAG: hypothetical protein AAF092_10795 [Pseudomonadota bacterium]